MADKRRQVERVLLRRNPEVFFLLNLWKGKEAPKGRVTVVWKEG